MKRHERVTGLAMLTVSLALIGTLCAEVITGNYPGSVEAILFAACGFLSAFMAGRELAA